MSRKFIVSLITLSATIVLGACGSTKEESSKKKMESAEASVEVKSGTYVLQDGDSVPDNEGYLALNLSIKNNTKDTLDIMSDDFSLYDEDGNKISTKDIYSEDDSFKNLEATTLSGGKTVSGYMVFNVEKDKKYELHYSPVLDEKKTKDIQLAIDSSKYEDQTAEAKEATSEYIDQVFLNKKADGTEKKAILANDVKKEHSDFNQGFMEDLKTEFDSDVPTTVELTKLVTSFEQANQKKAKVTYQIASMFPHQVTVNVKPETIDLEKIDTESILDKFVDENEDKYNDYDKAEQAATNYLIQQLPSKFASAQVSTSDYMSKDGYKIKLTEKDGKWTVDSSDSTDNSNYSDLVMSFKGGLGDY
ncbi:hypothetical protein IGI37_001366 [Enterococcus sp. AZ194]|uniref:DUF4352 domain-containing protein n=1 Tax=Enterococcus sp. AZ194 TaxID=2774629 RepID=UPI003F23B120